MARYQTILACSALFASLAAARADLVVEQQGGNTNLTYRTTLKIRGDKLRADQENGNGHTFGVIVDLNTRDSITLLPQQKMFMKMSGAEIERQIESEPKTAHGTNDVEAAPARPVATGRVEKAGGYNAEIYQWSGARGRTETLWVAKDFPDYDNIRKDLAKLDRFDASGPHRNAQPELSLLPGMVMKTEKTVNGKTTTVTLVSAKETPVDVSVFELPAGYTEWKPLSMPGPTNEPAATNQ